MFAKRRSSLSLDKLPYSNIAFLTCCLLVIGHVSSMSLDRLGRQYQQQNDKQLEFSELMLPEAESEVLENDMELVPAFDGDSDMYLLVPASAAGQEQNLQSLADLNESEHSGNVESNSDMLMLESEDTPAMQILELPKDKLDTKIANELVANNKLDLESQFSNEVKEEILNDAEQVSDSMADTIAKTVQEMENEIETELFGSIKTVKKEKPIEIENATIANNELPMQHKDTENSEHKEIFEIKTPEQEMIGVVMEESNETPAATMEAEISQEIKKGDEALKIELPANESEMQPAFVGNTQESKEQMADESESTIEETQSDEESFAMDLNQGMEEKRKQVEEQSTEVTADLVNKELQIAEEVKTMEETENIEQLHDDKQINDEKTEIQKATEEEKAVTNVEAVDETQVSAELGMQAADKDQAFVKEEITLSDEVEAEESTSVEKMQPEEDNITENIENDQVDTEIKPIAPENLITSDETEIKLEVAEETKAEEAQADDETQAVVENTESEKTNDKTQFASLESQTATEIPQDVVHMEVTQFKEIEKNEESVIETSANKETPVKESQSENEAQHVETEPIVADSLSFLETNKVEKNQLTSESQIVEESQKAVEEIKPLEESHVFEDIQQFDEIQPSDEKLDTEEEQLSDEELSVEETQQVVEEQNDDRILQAEDKVKTEAAKEEPMREFEGAQPIEVIKEDFQLMEEPLTMKQKESIKEKPVEEAQIIEEAQPLKEEPMTEFQFFGGTQPIELIKDQLQPMEETLPTEKNESIKEEPIEGAQLIEEAQPLKQKKPIEEFPRVEETQHIEEFQPMEDDQLTVDIQSFNELQNNKEDLTAEGVHSAKDDDENAPIKETHPQHVEESEPVKKIHPLEDNHAIKKEVEPAQEIEPVMAAQIDEGSQSFVEETQPSKEAQTLEETKSVDAVEAEETKTVDAVEAIKDETKASEENQSQKLEPVKIMQSVVEEESQSSDDDSLSADEFEPIASDVGNEVSNDETSPVEEIQPSSAEEVAVEQEKFEPVKAKPEEMLADELIAEQNDEQEQEILAAQPVLLVNENTEQNVKPVDDNKNEKVQEQAAEIQKPLEDKGSDNILSDDTYKTEPIKETTSMLTTIVEVPTKEQLTQQQEVQEQQQIQEQQPTTTLKPFNVLDSVLNYVNASFINHMSNDNNSDIKQEIKEEQAFSSQLRRYDGAQVWRIVVQNDRERKLADELQTKYDGQLWKEVKQEVDYLLKPQVLAEAERHVKAANLSRIVLIDNLQQVIEVENPPAEIIEQLQNRKGHRLTWEAYHRLDDIHSYFDYMTKTYPDICSVETIGYSIEKKPLRILKISNGNPNNPGIWIDGGMHAREWISPAVVTYISNQIIEGWEELPAYMRNINWYIHAVANPDGYEYSHTTDRLWRKNMRSHGRACPGVDLNRNFGYKWGGKGTSANPCSQTYRGSKAFSEPETFYISKFISNFPRETFKAYLSFHSYGQYILYPWGYDYHITKDMADLDLVARQAGTIITKSTGVKYTVGSSANTLYPAAGGSDDWAKGIAGIKYSYTIEMGDTGRYGFVLPAKYIEPNGQNGMTFVETVAKAITMGKNGRRRKLKAHKTH